MLPGPPLNHVSKHHIYTSLNTSRDGDSTTSLGSLLQCLTTLLVKRFFVISSLNLSGGLLEAISSRPIIHCLGEETNTCLTTTSFQVVVESNKVSPQPPFFQTKKTQFPQLLLTGLVLYTFHQLHCPSLDMLQHLNVFLVARVPKLNTVFKVPSTGGRSFP